MKFVSEYTGLSFVEVNELTYYEYRLLIRESIIYEANKTERGQEWLKECWILEQTEPDRESLRSKFGKGG